MSTQSVFLGMNAKLYIGTDVLDGVKDVTLNLSSATADVTTRNNSGWRATVRTLKEASVSFQMVLTSDSDVGDIITSFLNSSTGSGSGSSQLLQAAVLDEAKGEGIVGEWSVTSCNRGENLEDAITYDIEMSLTKFIRWNPRGTDPSYTA